MARKKKPAGPDAKLSLVVNGRKIQGERRAGRWQFACDWPDIAERHSGAADTSAAVTEFMGRAMMESVRFQVQFTEIQMD